MRYLIAVGLLLIMISPAFSQNVQFAWDAHPEAAQIVGFHLWQSKTSGSGYAQVATFTPGTLTTGVIPKPGLGRYYYVLTAYVTDAESDYSNEVSLVLKPQKPTLKSAIQTALLAPVRGIAKLAGLFTHKNLKVKKG